MNRKRQEIEAEIYREAASMLPTGGRPEAIVRPANAGTRAWSALWRRGWRRNITVPRFSSASTATRGRHPPGRTGGFNLFAALRTLSPLLESYGGHELAAGFTIRRENIDAFRAQITELARAFRASGECQSALEIDCEIPPRLLTLENVAALDELEPCGVGCPRPVLALRGFRVEELTEVGGGKHLRLRLTSGRAQLGRHLLFHNGAPRRRERGRPRGSRVHAADQRIPRPAHGAAQSGRHPAG